MEREETEEKESVRKTEKERHEMKYKVGDEVRVRSDLKNTVLYGGLYAVDEMLKKKIVTITSVHDDYYEVVEDNYKWTDEMLDGLVEDELTAEEATKILSEICCENELCGGCPISEAKGKMTCQSFRRDKTEEVLEILKRWKKDHEKKEVETEFTWCVLIIEANTHTLKHEEKVETYIKSVDAKKAEILKKYCSEHNGKYYAISERRCVVKE
jgi:hypothetical protein